MFSVSSYIFSVFCSTRWLISSTPFKVKLGLRDQGVGQVWKTNWSWQFQWTTRSCCSCMVLERILDVHLLPFKLCLMKSASMQVYLHKMLVTDTDLPLPAGHWIKEFQQWHFIIPQQRSGDGMDWWIFQETLCQKTFCYLRSTLASPTPSWQWWGLSQMGSCWN